MGGPDRIPVDAWGSRDRRDRCDRPRAREAQPWLARAFFLRFASFRFRFTEGFS